MNKAVKYGAGLIALYLLVAYYTGSGTLLSKGGEASAGVIKAFQGR